MPNQHGVDTGISCWQPLWPTHLFCPCASCDAIQNLKLTKHEDHSTAMCCNGILMLDEWLMFACGPKRFPLKKTCLIPNRPSSPCLQSLSRWKCEPVAWNG
ncbi:unnamed protein product [Polarella glacialis]|uniref:Uncharacterized protein n=1 Tax=Polarella glacialis TaxID=89957 RepID=A0A813H6F3_POLGL|nr:unnamed protein product [Polarella glacialis]